MSFPILGVLFVLSPAALYLWVLAEMRRVHAAPRLSTTDEANNSRTQATVTVIIAARDESPSVGTCLQSILGQQAVKHVIFIDDHSSDCTLDIARNMAQNDSRLMVLSAPPLPYGWIGKSHALHYASQLVQTKYLLFTDADVWMAPGIVRAAASQMDRDNLDHLGGYFFIHCSSVAEEVCAPVLAISSTIALFRSAPSLGAATGAFNMMRTHFYRDIGGHQPIRNKTVDDIALARYSKAAGGKTCFVDTSKAVKVRLFIGFRGFADAVARSAVPFLQVGKVPAFCSAILLLLQGFATAAAFCVAVGTPLWRPPFFGSHAAAWAVSIATPYLLGFACILQSRRYHDGRMAWGLLYPVPMVILAFSTARGAAYGLLGRRISWRGRTYERV
jgi:cellulose synthase/poly-beta-1,6-N-acetylglucosamine synthase-like glycosyltransferase